MFNTRIFAMSILFFCSIAEAEDSLDAAFLEWLGQTAELEELGVDIESLIEEQEQTTPSQDDEEKTK